MIRPLRKTHLLIWISWSFIIPLAIILALVAREDFPADEVTHAGNEGLLPVLIRAQDLRGNTLQLRGFKNGFATQLIWFNKQPLSSPSAAIYLAASDTASIAGSEYLGTIETRGRYSFLIPQKHHYHFIVYDFIHHKIIDRIKF